MGEHGMRRAFTADVPYHVPYLISNYWVRKYGWENFHPALAQLFSPALHKSRSEALIPLTGMKGRTDGLTDGLASKHMPSYQQKHRIKILKHLSATFTF